MLIYHQLKIRYEHSEDELKDKLASSIRVPIQQISSFSIVKKSIDARKKPQIFLTYSVVFSIPNEDVLLNKSKDNNLQKYYLKKYHLPGVTTTGFKSRPVIIGAGPCGLFAALILAKCGLCPIVFERGKAIPERSDDVDLFWRTGELNPESNVQFGEGGAGTFSDGKLNTQVKDKEQRMQFILEQFVQYGADPSILYDNKPHIGTDVLKDVIIHMREDIESMGGQFHFSHKITDFHFEDGKLQSLTINHTEKFLTDVCILAIGHSARDTFRKLYECNVPMEQKNFSVGVRVEHERELIDASQFGESNVNHMPAADYKLTYQASSGKGVYSFCMCPGGHVVNASSEKGKLAINGMSYHARNGANSNSAIVVQVDKSDFANTDILAGLYFQEQIEKLAFCEGNGKVIVQKFEDFKNNNFSDFSAFRYSPTIKGEIAPGNIRNILPESICTSIIEGMKDFGKKIKGFDHPSTILSAPETRTSSPVRITRNESFESDFSGLFPAGEGAGYAGGIISAAMDGMKVAERICTR